MHLKNPLLFGLMAILLLGGTITPGLSQSSPESGVVINEVELNPKGSDAGYGVGGSGIDSKTTIGLSGAQEYVELYNTSDETIDISGWSIVPTATWKSLVIPDDTTIEPNEFLAFTYVNFWFKDFGETISLVDVLGNKIDETPLLKDNDDESTSWQRITDGLDTDSESDWELKRYTPKSSNNNQITETQESIFTLNGGLDKSEYFFGETLTISGNVSEELFTSLASPEIIKISVKGSNYFKNFALFPDRNLDFSTSLNLQKVLGFNEGTYDVTISYAEHYVETNFAIISEVSSSANESDSFTLEIFTEKESYIPGEIVVMHADTTSDLEYAGLDYDVTNPNGDVVFKGTIFPNERFSTVFQQGAGQIYPFSTQMYMQTVNPVYGTYEINGIYKSQNTMSNSSDDVLFASTTFTLVEDIKENIPISISTDKEIYSVDDIVKVTGRSNNVWVETLDLNVIQSGVISTNPDDVKSQYIRPDPFTLKESIRLNGDGTFEFEFKLVASSSADEDYSSTYGDYKVTVSEHFGSGSTMFKVVEDPESFIDIRTPLGLKTDQSEYALGSGLTITGSIMNYEYKSAGNVVNTIDITFTTPTGDVITFEDHQQKTGYTNCHTNDCSKYSTPLVYSAMPDIVGTFQISAILSPLQFDYGVYTITAEHRLSKTTESIQFEIKSPQSEMITGKETKDPLEMKICKSNRASNDEILKDLRTIGKGEIPPSMDSVDCSLNQIFNVGDKLVVTGKVIPKTGTSLDQSSTKTSGSTEQGSSYSTNYSESMMNYVEVSIPYPKSMTVTKSGAWQTTPNEGENYTGGGGSGNQGSAYYKDKDGNVIRPDAQCEATANQKCSGSSRSDRIGEGSYDGTAVLDKQIKLLTDMSYKAYPDKDGNFATIFELRAGIFSSGTYSVKSHYFGYNDEQTVTVVDNSLKGGLKPEILISLQQDEFTPGETVSINGLIKNIYYYDTVSVIIETPDISKINCLKGQQCGFDNSEKKLRVQETVDGPKFFWNYKIPDVSGSIGTYNIIVDTHFGETQKQFFVVDDSEIIGTPETSPNKTKKIIEKVNRISDNEISITLDEKQSDDSLLVPRVLQGSLFTSARGEESDVNLRITTTGGQCIIGQNSDCLVSESTRKPGAIHSIVTIDDVNYKIRYSGNDVRLEKFSIVPEESGTKINIDNWNVQVMKDEQPSRFYYKVSYVALE